MAIKLITTARTPIIDNRIVLPLTPIGDIPFNRALVFVSIYESVPGLINRIQNLRLTIIWSII